MKTKRYRAATMREALEKVKQELGEDALVLDSKRVRAGGFLGIGSKDQVEVRVAAEESYAEADEFEIQHSPQHKSKTISLNLTDNTPALPARPSLPRVRGTNSAYAALTARASADEPSRAAAQAERAQPTERTQREDFVPIEVATTAPRIVHRRKPVKVEPVKSAPAPAPSPVPSAADITTPANASPAQHDAYGRELERMRAELRELKFSLNAFSTRVSDTASKAFDSFEADAEIYDSPFYEAYLEMAELGLTPDIARRGVRYAVSLDHKGVLSPSELAREALKQFLPTLVKFEADPLAPDQKPGALALVGPTGVGKTTTLAKLAARLALRQRKRVELITLDTYRIAAVEQLKTYAEIIGAGFHVPRSILELDTIVRRFEGEACVLIDTIGRSPNDLADQLELADYLRASERMTKCLVLQATTQAADASVAIRKFALYGANRLAITKLDETTKPGTALNTAAASGLPLAYICAGQRVPEDIECATPETFSARIMRPNVIALAA